MTLWTDVWELFFPRYCVVCGRRLLREERHLCLDCYCDLPRTRFHSSPGNEIEKCLWGKCSINRAGAFLFYAKGGSVRKVLYELKYYGNQDIGRYLGRCMAKELLPSGFFDGVDGIIPVPLHSKKRKARGYNQSELLAEGIAEITHIPIYKDVLVREQYTETQTHKNLFERWENVKSVFGYASEADLSSMHILLVDDVLTTGATLVACADALGKMSGLQVSVLTLAWAGES